MRRAPTLQHMTLVLSLLLSHTAPSLAQDSEVRQREALRRLQQQAQSAIQEKTRLESEKAKLEQEKAALQKDAAASEQRARRASAGEKKLRQQLGAEVEQLRTELLGQRKRGDDLQTELSALTRRSDQTVDELGKQSAEAKRLAAILTEQREIIGRQAGLVQACDEKNLKLYELNRAILKEYRNKGVFDSLFQAEPFTGIKDVQIQNILEEYKEKLDAQRVEKAEIQLVR